MATNSDNNSVRHWMCQRMERAQKIAETDINISWNSSLISPFHSLRRKLSYFFHARTVLTSHSLLAPLHRLPGFSDSRFAFVRSPSPSSMISLLHGLLYYAVWAMLMFDINNRVIYILGSWRMWKENRGKELIQFKEGIRVFAWEHECFLIACLIFRGSVCLISAEEHIHGKNAHCVLSAL